MALSLHSMALQGTNRFVSCEPIRQSQPFHLEHVNCGYGQMQDAASSLALQYQTDLSFSNLSVLDVAVYDPQTGREVTELSQWSMFLEILTR